LKYTVRDENLTVIHIKRKFEMLADNKRFCEMAAEVITQRDDGYDLFYRMMFFFGELVL